MQVDESQEERPLKRTRQACDTCRRKKSKCSGERPVCSTCDRLRQSCTYNLEHPYASLAEHEQTRGLSNENDDITQTRLALALAESDRKWQSRFESLESTLVEALKGVRTSVPPQASSRFPQQQHDQPNHSPTLMPCTSTAVRPSSQSPSTSLRQNITLPSRDTVLALAKVYLTYCDSQPLPLFDRENFISTFEQRDPEIVYAVLALASKIPVKSHNLLLDEEIDAKSLIDSAHQLVMSRLVSQCVELSTLQTLALLAVNEINNGNLDQCRVHCSMAMTLARCAQLHREVSDRRNDCVVEERRRCYWSTVLLHRLIGEPITIAPNETSHLAPLFPISASSPPTVTSPEGERRATTMRLNGKEGILSVVIRLSEVWPMAQMYVRNQRSSGHRSSPWSPQSDYSLALTTLMDIGQQLPPVHRYRFLRLSHVTGEELQGSREYWGPWFLSRFIYHTSICILNHPILIMLQLQGSQDVSEVFLQQSLFSLTNHTKWILHFIEFLESRKFRMFDPIVAYCAAVVATIELHQSFIEDDQGTRKKKKQGYDQCLKFILDLCHQWSYLEQIANKLQNLAETMAVSYETTLTKGSDRISIDISGFFDILDLSTFFSLARHGEADGSIFGPTLRFQPSPPAFNQTSLVRLPPITVIESTDGTMPNNTSDGPVDNLPPQPAENHEPSTPHVFSNEMSLPADQFFGGYWHDTSAWDFILGTSGGHNPFA